MRDIRPDGPGIAGGNLVCFAADGQCHFSFEENSCLFMDVLMTRKGNIVIKQKQGGKGVCPMSHNLHPDAGNEGNKPVSVVFGKHSTPGFYDQIFEAIFDDVVNLDTIREQNERLKELVEAGVVKKESLTPEVEFSGERDLTEDERELLEELDTLLSCRGIREVITKNLHLPVSHIRTLFFDVKNQKAVIATGLFNDAGKALSDTEHCNLEIVDEGGASLRKNDNQGLVLGLHRDNELIKSIITNNDPYRLYFSLPILAHELALCQKLLVPYSPCYHLVKEQLARDMRQALMEQLLTEVEAA